MSRILVTGSRGLIGSALAHSLTASGYEVVEFDVSLQPEPKDVTDPSALAEAINGCSGVVHLGAVSRVLWGEQDPVRCRQVNVGGTKNVLEISSQAATQPWVLVASSREVYGQPDTLPVAESANRAPLNEYGHTKLDAERLVESAAQAGLRASVIRFSNVYGSVDDHSDRVVPAFARQAAAGAVLRIDGPDATFDFTHIEDVTRALQTAVDLLATSDISLPALHLVSGRATTLAELAAMAIAAAGQGSTEVQPYRDYDVKQFVGDPTLAAQVLQWRTAITIEDGMSDLVRRFSKVSRPPG